MWTQKTTKLRKLRSKKALVDAEIIKILEPSAKSECRRLCDGILNGLPREIRDLVYDHVHAHDTIYVGPEYMRGTIEPCESDRGAHYWNLEYVGESMKRELVESWYRNTLFYFYDKKNNAQVAKDFLVTDRWGLGIQPRNFIRNVRFELGRCEGKLHHYGSLCCADVAQTTSLLAPLTDMHLLPNHVSFFIRIHTYGAFSSGCLEPLEWREIVGALIDNLKDMWKAGHRFVVQWVELDLLEFSSRDCGFSEDDWMAELAGGVRVRSGIQT